MIAEQPDSVLFQIPWRHQVEIVSKCSSVTEALFYVHKTIENGWSRAVLVHQIESDLFSRAGKAISNFRNTLPAVQSDLAQQITKDPYIFDFAALTERYNEKELEGALADNITRFLLELGAGFTFYGKQVHLNVNGDDFYLDLLFYHIKLHCYVVVELKAVKFQPEYAGQLNFYIAAVDGQLKSPEDKATIGILICKDKNDVVVEYALQNISSPIGVSSYEISRILSEEYQNSLPTIEELEKELTDPTDR